MKTFPEISHMFASFRKVQGQRGLLGILFYCLKFWLNKINHIIYLKKKSHSKHFKCSRTGSFKRMVQFYLKWFSVKWFWLVNIWETCQMSLNLFCYWLLLWATSKPCVSPQSENCQRILPGFGSGEDGMSCLRSWPRPHRTPEISHSDLQTLSACRVG